MMRKPLTGWESSALCLLAQARHNAALRARVLRELNGWALRVGRAMCGYAHSSGVAKRAAKSFTDWADSLPG